MTFETVILQGRTDAAGAARVIEPRGLSGLVLASTWEGLGAAADISLITIDEQDATRSTTTLADGALSAPVPLISLRPGVEVEGGGASAAFTVRLLADLDHASEVYG